MAQAKAEVEVEFAEALRRAGLRPKGAPIMDGRKHRVPVEGDRPGRRSGTYIGHFDEHPAGYIHNFKTGEEIRWKASHAWPALSRAERHGELARIEEARAAREAVRRRREEAVADLAVRAWNRARPVETHPYLARKGTGAHDLRQNRSGHLLVPMRDADGRLWGIQTIDAAGTKRFMGGGRKQGLFAALGTPGPGEPVVIAEGYVTAAALREATGLATIAAFDSGNLLDVARAVREREPARRVVIAADNDHQLPRRVVPLPNVGLEKATAAAEAVGGVVLSPAFASGDKGTDWNDYSVQHGREALRVATQTTLRAHGMALPSGPRAARTDQTTVMSAAPTQADRDAARQRLQGGAGTGATEAAAREAARQAQRERAPRARP